MQFLKKFVAWLGQASLPLWLGLIIAFIAINLTIGSHLCHLAATKFAGLPRQKPAG